MVSLHCLKYAYDLSDESVIAAGKVENPYWQYLSGMKYFTQEGPLDSSIRRWRKRIAEVGVEELLSETLEAGLRMKVVKSSQLKNVNVDTTVQEKERSCFVRTIQPSEQASTAPAEPVCPRTSV